MKPVANFKAIKTPFFQVFRFNSELKSFLIFLNNFGRFWLFKSKAYLLEETPDLTLHRISSIDALNSIRNFRYSRQTLPEVGHIFGMVPNVWSAPSTSFPHSNLLKPHPLRCGWGISGYQRVWAALLQFSLISTPRKSCLVVHIV